MTYRIITRRFLGLILSVSLLLGTALPAPKSVSAAPVESIKTLEHETELPGEAPVDEAVPADEVPGVVRRDAGGESRSAYADDDTLTDQEAAPKAAIITEDTGSRDLYNKDFLLSDMSHLAVTYPDAVHYEADGGWNEIDNTLGLYGKEGEEVWRNRANSVIMELPALLTSENGPRISCEEDSFGFSLTGIKTSEEEITRISPVTAEINNELITEKELEGLDERGRQIIPMHLSSEAVYRDILPGMDLIYTLSSVMLKETIAIYEKSEADISFVFDLKGEDFTFRQEDDGSITVINAAGEDAFEITAPYVRDEGYDYCHEVKVVLESQDTGSCRLIYTVPAEWLCDSERVWPVYLDPTVVTNRIRQNIKDKTVCSGSNSATHYNDDSLEVGYRSGRGIERSLMRFLYIPTLTSADVIINAGVQIYRDSSMTNPFQINLHRATNDWDSENVYWSTQPGFESQVTDFCMVNTAKWYSWYITDIARRWYSEGNYGFVLKATDAVESAGSGAYRTLCSSDYSSSSYRPILIINYRNNSGYESYWDYDGYDAGRAGGVGVNLFTGNAVIQRSDMGFDGERMPVNITFTYNANEKDSDIFYLGYGWRTNYNQRVYLYSAPDDTGTGGYTYYIWEDGDGTKHYFRSTSSPTNYEDEDGLELTMTKSGSGSSLTYVITDKKGNTSTFDSKGRLTALRNNQSTQSSVTVQYHNAWDTDYRISQITDGAGRKYRFDSYGTGNRLSAITYLGYGTSGISYTTYGYDSSGNMTTVGYPDGGTASYSYNSRLIYQLTDSASHKVTVTYASTTSPCRVSNVRVYESTASSTNILTSYSYGRDYTLVTDDNGKKLEYQFNSYGNTVSVQDQGGRALYARYATDLSSGGKANQLKLSSKLQSSSLNLIKNGSFEWSTHWNASVGSGATGSYGYTGATNPDSTVPVTDPYIGERCYYMAKTNSDGFLEISSGTGMSFKSNTAYTVSAYVKTTSFSSGRGVIIGATINGQPTWVEGISSPGKWERFELNFTTPAESVSGYHIYLRLYSQGTVFFDCVQIEENALASRYNLIENGDFRHWDGTTASAYKWERGGTATVSSEYRTTLSSNYIDAPGIDRNVMVMTGKADVGKVLYQPVFASGSQGDVYSLGGWAKGNSAPEEGGSFFGFVLRFYYNDGTTGEFRLHFNTDLYEADTWQYACERIVAAKDYNELRIFLRYDYNVNSCCYDAIQLFKDEYGSSYVYDSDGNVTSVTDSRQRANTYEYTSNDLTKATLHDGSVYTYDYDDHHNVTSA
ncbi:MAG: RHS repeat protein [Lachnospiraceae bacterium]|nr:RHS repeat protein [Lachnospiraceae bacterium]